MLHRLLSRSLSPLRLRLTMALSVLQRQRKWVVRGRPLLLLLLLLPMLLRMMRLLVMLLPPPVCGWLCGGACT